MRSLGLGARKAEAVSVAGTGHAAALLLTLVSAAASAAELAIESPKPDSLVSTSKIAVRGTVNTGDDVVLQVESAAAAAVESAGGHWSVLDVDLQDGANVLKVTTESDVTRVLVTSATDIVERGKQRVFLRWDPAADAELIKIAAGTLQPAPTTTKQASFVSAVKQKTATIIADNFSPFNVELVGAPDEDTHVIKFMPTGGSDLFGHSMTDCLNQEAAGQSEVFVGTLRAAMVPLSAKWGPMQPTDKFAVRVADVAHALARTASHELGHGLGLVSGSTPVLCQWMEGCDGDHNCLAFDTSNELADRFANGRYIMDPGPRKQPFARIAEKNAQSRGTRTPATFGTFGSDYLMLVQPR